MALDESKTKLFNQVKTKLGAPIRKVELTDEQLCSLLTISVGQYASIVQSYIIENNWANLYGKNLSNTDLAFAISVRSLDFMQDYSYYFSKEVGLQQRGGWELKKDFIRLEQGRQVYVVPAGREINKVMWVQPSTLDAAMWSMYGGGMGLNYGGGLTGQMGIGAATAFAGIGGNFGMGVGIWALPAYDIALMATDLSFKRSMLRSELTYKITAGPDGTHLIHLMSTPGSPFTFGMGIPNTIPLHNCTCWYTYYDTTSENVDECRKQNTNVVLSPDQIPLEEMDYDYLNSPTQALVRQILIGEAAETLGLIRGKFMGNINMIASPLQMDYNMLISLGQREKEKALKMIEDRMQRLSPYEMMKRQAELVNNMIEAKKGIPLGMYVI